MAVSKKTLTRITVGSEDYYLLSTALGVDGQEGFEVVLSNGVDGWSGSRKCRIFHVSVSCCHVFIGLALNSVLRISVDENDLESLSQEVEMHYEHFVDQTKKAFSRTNLGNLNFVYQVKKQKDGSAVFSWKKMMPENIKVKSGCETVAQNCKDRLSWRERIWRLQFLISDPARFGETPCRARFGDYHSEAV